MASLASLVGKNLGIKGAVSQNRKRLNVTIGEDKYDLDLTYITPQIIAMAWPGSGVEKLYRNDIKAVRKYLNTMHSGHYKVYNLAEKSYDAAEFDFRVCHFPFPDHNPPRLELLRTIVYSMQHFLAADTQNVVAVHCYAGKGRTGLCISCLLMLLDRINDSSVGHVDMDVQRIAQKSLEKFASERSYSCIGVQNPSQLRYAEYFAKVLVGEGAPKRMNHSGPKALMDFPEMPSGIPVFLKEIILDSVPDYNKEGGFLPSVMVYEAEGAGVGGNLLYNSSWDSTSAAGGIDRSPLLVVPGLANKKVRISLGRDGVPVQDDVQVRVLHNDEVSLRLNFHTGFLPFLEGVNQLALPFRKYEVDKACKSSRYSEDWYITLLFEKPETVLPQRRLAGVVTESSIGVGSLDMALLKPEAEGLCETALDQEENGVPGRRRARSRAESRQIEQDYLATETKKGYMKKLGGFVRNWKERWFVLEHGYFSYFKTMNSPSPIHRLCLVDYSINVDNSMPATFKIEPLTLGKDGNPKGRSYIIKCKTEEEMLEWMNAAIKHSAIAQQAARDRFGIRGKTVVGSPKKE